MSNEITQLFLDLDRLGVIESFLPFILIFAIVWAILNSTQILGGNRRVNLILALSIGLLVVMPHLTNREPDVVNIINTAIPNVAVVIVAVVMLLILAGVFGGWTLAGMTGLGGVVALLAVGVIVFIFGGAAGWWGRLNTGPLRFLGDSDTQALIIILLAFGLIIFFITGDDKAAGTPGGFQKIFDELGKIWRK